MAIKALPNGRYRVVVDERGGDRTTRPRATRTVDTEAEAVELEASLKARTGEATGRRTVLAAVDRYVAQHGPTLEASSERSLYSTRDTYFATSWLGELELDYLGVDDLERFYAEVFAGTWRQGAKPRGRSTVVKIHRLLRPALAKAKRAHWLATNPALEAEVDVPKAARPKPSAADEYDLGDIARLLDVDALEVVTLGQVARETGRPADAEAYRRRKVAALEVSELVQVALATGAREGELAALRWRDVELRVGEVSFAGAVGPKRRPEKGHERKSTKTGKPRRMIVDEECRATLEARYLRHVEQARAAGVDPDDLDRRAVFSLELEVDYTSPAALGARWRRAAKRAGVELTFHDVRHVNCSEMTAGDVPVTAATARSGHGSNRMYHDVYSHHRRARGDDPAVAVLAGTWAEVVARRKVSG